jgi:Maltose acetyltransferase
MLAGDLYIADDPELHEKMARAERLSREYGELTATDPEAARTILAASGSRSGRGPSSTITSSPDRSSSRTFPPASSRSESGAGHPLPRLNPAVPVCVPQALTRSRR